MYQNNKKGHKLIKQKQKKNKKKSKQKLCKQFETKKAGNKK